MPETTVQKNNIVLSDYNFQRDIENRLLMAELSIFDVDVLREILDSSLKIPIKQLAIHFNTSEKKLIPTLDKLARVKLLQHSGGAITVDKEMRKYYESQILKFDDDFRPDMEFLQGLFTKVPIHVLPKWYAISHGSTNIYSSIITTFFGSPKIYESYLSHLTFHDPALEGIMKDVFESDDCKVHAPELMKKYRLTRAKFEEHMLFLEYSLVCCLSYNRVGDVWEEVVTPFQEWRDFLRFQHKSIPKAIKKTDAIKCWYPNDLGTIENLTTLLKTIQHESIPCKGDNEEVSIATKDALKILPELKNVNVPFDYLKELMIILAGMRLVSIKSNKLQASATAKEWLSQNLHDKQLSVYRYCMHRLRDNTQGYTQKDIHEVERSLKRVAHLGWIDFEEFMEGFIAPIGKNAPISLQNKGKRWFYALPEYSEQDIDFIKNVLTYPLFLSGMIIIGERAGKLCFNVTSFGRQAIGL